MPPDMQIPSARTTTYSHRKQRVSPSVSRLSRRVASRLARQSPNQPEPHASHPLVARPSPAGRLHRRRARVSCVHTQPPRHESPSRARRACTRTRVIDHHPAASTHHVLALQQLLGDDRGQSTEEVTLGVDDDNLRCASMGLVRQSSRSVVSSFASSSASIDPSFGRRENPKDDGRAIVPSVVRDVVGDVARRAFGRPRREGHFHRRRARPRAVVDAPYP